MLITADPVPEAGGHRHHDPNPRSAGPRLGQLDARGTGRRAAAAITQLRLNPVLFELGARPYPPRDLYRAYLEQSDVFIGIYAESYGWVGPGMEVSGLEDEYRLSAGKPRDIRLVGVSRSFAVDFRYHV
jgi:hypothetical protein